MLQFVVFRGGSSRFVAVRFCASSDTKSQTLFMIHIEEAHVLVSMRQIVGSVAVRGGLLRLVAAHRA